LKVSGPWPWPDLKDS